MKTSLCRASTFSICKHSGRWTVTRGTVYLCGHKYCSKTVLPQEGETVVLRECCCLLSFFQGMGERLPPSALAESFLWTQYIPPKCSNTQSSMQDVNTQNITIILPSRLKMMKCAVNYSVLKPKYYC
jgi:hypothetical protein